MNTKNVILMLFILVFMFNPCLVSNGYEKILLQDIVDKIESYKGKEVKLKLKLKNLDPVFDLLFFYDRKNNDIVFDISEIKKKDQFKRQILNLHEGMEYLVIFIVKDVGNIGEIIGEIISFKSFVLLKLPEGNFKSD